MALFLIRSIAKMADASGMFRVRVSSVSETIQTREDAETLVYYQSEMRSGFPVEIIETTAEEWEAAKDGSMCGYAKASALDAPWAPSPSVYDQDQPMDTAALAKLNID